jgi:hypothetical protein
MRDESIYAFIDLLICSQMIDDRSQMTKADDR